MKSQSPPSFLRRNLGPLALLACLAATIYLVSVGLSGQTPHWLMVISAVL